MNGSHDIEAIIKGVRAEIPAVVVVQVQRTHPGDDDGLWWFRLSGVASDIQIESSTHDCPFFIEHSDMTCASYGFWGYSVSDIVACIVAYLHSVSNQCELSVPPRFPGMMKPITGSCLCGEVAFEVTAAPLKFLYCHCRSCQRSSGSVHAANLAFPEGSVRWTLGEALIERFVDTQENPGFPRCFCRKCGSPVPKLSRSGKFWVVPSGTLDADPGMKPQANIYWAEHAEWYVSADELAKHEGPLVE